MTGKANLAGKLQTIFQIGDQRGLRHVKADLLHRVFEEQTVFGFLDGADLCADKMHVVFFENSGVGQLDGQVQGSLSTNGWEHSETGSGREFAFDANDLFEVRERERFDVGAIRQLGVGHDGGGVRIRQHHFKTFRLERLASLRAGVIKLRRLANDDRARAENQYFRDVCAFRHLCSFALGLKWRSLVSIDGLFPVPQPRGAALI